MIARPARAAALLCLAASACWVPVERGQQMEERIQRLEAPAVPLAERRC